jgi:hypothetical protein
MRSHGLRVQQAANLLRGDCDLVEFGGRSDTPTGRLAPHEAADGVFRGTVGPAGSHGFRAQMETGEDMSLDIGELS